MRLAFLAVTARKKAGVIRYAEWANPSPRHFSSATHAALVTSDFPIVDAKPLSSWRRLFWVCLAVLPFHSIHLAHFFQANATGFIQYDQPYYVANGREIFERGNGLAHPNPYDPAPNAPVIYFHWLIWLYGAAVKFTGADPAFCPLVTGWLAGLLTSWLTLLLVEKVLPDRRSLIPLFLLAMWGGGCLAVGAVVARKGDIHSLSDLLVLDPAAGWWFLNWGRNLVYPTEAVYHALVAGAWLAVLSQRENLALLLAAALAGTHPFSGVQLLLILGVWLIVRCIRDCTLAAWGRLLVWLLIFGAFCGYYFVFLNQFPQHRALQDVWTSSPEIWILPRTAMVLAYGPVAAFALWRLLSRNAPRGRDVWFFTICAAVTFILIKHDWLVSRPRQPIHFTHGYEWMPLFLLGLPKIQISMIWICQQVHATVRWLAPAALLLVASLDNTAFLGANFHDGAGNPLRLSADEREMFRWMEEQRLTGLLMAQDSRLCYLSATYTSVRPFAGHHFNTPDYSRRSEWMRGFFRTPVDPSWTGDVDYLLLPAADQSRMEFDGFKDPNDRWIPLHRNSQLVLMGRRARQQ